jgi:hypothetical protein
MIWEWETGNNLEDSSNVIIPVLEFTETAEMYEVNIAIVWDFKKAPTVLPQCQIDIKAGLFTEQGNFWLLCSGYYKQVTVMIYYCQFLLSTHYNTILTTQ